MRGIFKRGVDEHTAEQGNLYLYAVLLAVAVLLERFGFMPGGAETSLTLLYAFVVVSGFRILVMFDDRSEHRRKRRVTAAVLMVLATVAIVPFLLAE